MNRDSVKSTWSVCAVILACVACSRTDAPTPKPVDAASRLSASGGATVKSPRDPEPLKACALVTEAEMTTILGGPVSATSSDRPTECVYSAVSGIAPYARLAIDRGGAEAAMTAMGMMQKLEPGITNLYVGLGDQAATVGPEVWIKRGQDLIMILSVGETDTAARTKQIYELVDKRLLKAAMTEK